MHIVQQAADAAERIAGAGVMEKVEQLLEQAKLPLRPAEFLVYAPLAAIVVAAFAFLLFGPVIGDHRRRRADRGAVPDPEAPQQRRGSRSSSSSCPTR